jgi:MoaD family protein
LICVHALILDWNIKQLIGQTRIDVELQENNAIIRSLVEKLDKEYGGRIAEAISKSNLFILVNGQDTEFLGGQDTRLSDGDSVAITPVVAGG